MELVDLKGPWFGSILLTLSVVLYRFQVLRKRKEFLQGPEISLTARQIKISPHVIQHYWLIYFDLKKASFSVQVINKKISFLLERI